MSFNYNFPKYFGKVFSGFPKSLNSQPQNNLFDQKNFQINKQPFAKDIYFLGDKTRRRQAGESAKKNML